MAERGGGGVAIGVSLPYNTFQLVLVNLPITKVYQVRTAISNEYYQ